MSVRLRRLVYLLGQSRHDGELRAEIEAHRALHAAHALGRIDPDYLYVPGEGSAVLVKGRTGVATAVSGIRAAVRAVDPTLLVTVLPLEASLGWSRRIAGRSRASSADWACWRWCWRRSASTASCRTRSPAAIARSAFA